MNERKFLKLLNDKNNEDGSLTFLYVSDLINSNQLVLKRNIFPFFNKVLTRFTRFKSPRDIISDNFDLIISKLSYTYMDLFLREIYSFDNSLIKDNFDLITKKINPKPLINFLKDYMKDSPENQQFVLDNEDIVFNNIDKGKIFDFISVIKDVESDKDKLNKILEDNKLEICKQWIRSPLLIGINEEITEDAEKYNKTLAIIIDELLKSENKRWIDIEKKGFGSFSEVYKIGSKILKIGKPRVTYNIPDHKRILKSLIRTNLYDRSEKTKIGCIEVMEEVSSAQGLSFEELYEIYKELRKDGIIWTDVKSSNVGLLKKDNKTYYNGEEYEVSKKSLGYKEKEIEEGKQDVLKEGDLVVIDTDYIFLENDPDVAWPSNYLYDKFERKYQNECLLEIVKNHNKSKDINDSEKTKDVEEK